MASSSRVINLIEDAKRTGSSTLDLRGYGLTILPEEITKLTALTSIDLSFNNLITLPESFAQLTNLSSLQLWGNNLTTLPGSVTKLTNLTSLDLTANGLTTLPDSTARLIKLTKLDLRNNGLTTLPQNISRLTNLLSLYLSGNSLMTLPECVTHLTNLRGLYVSANSLTALPENINQLNHLTELDLWGNALTTLPESIAQLTNLTSLNLSNNLLITLPDSLSKLTNLATLDLSCNGMTVLPEVTTMLIGLVSLYIASNNMTNLPESLTMLSNLANLDLSNNSLSALPESVRKLTNLTNINLNSNQLNTLTEIIGQLRELTSLDLRKNHLVSLPKSITRCTKLRSLYLNENNLNLPPEISRSIDARTILDYLRRVQASPASNQPLNEAKVVLVGEAGAGKTSLIKRLTVNEFDPNEPKTDGIDIHRWDLDGVYCVDREGNKDTDHRKIRLNVWDLGGQEIYHATHQFFLTERTLYLLVISARLTDDQNRLHYWLKTIRALGKEAPIVIVHNHHETNTGQLDRKTLREKYPTISPDGFFETSCARETLKGIDTLKDAIRREIGQIHHVADPLPYAYFTVKEQLEEETSKHDFVSSEYYTALCQKEGITEPAEYNNLLGLLHALGTVISFQDDLRLRGTNVLNPEWVTEGVYSILDDPRLKSAADGILNFDALPQILNNTQKKYPADKHSFILDMMARFELCFERIGKPGEYLIPELLTPIEPDEIGDFSDALRFELQYDFLPRSVLPRFIVGTHHLLQPYRWRNGVVIENADNYALIRADIEDKKVRIAVAGNKNTRRDLLSILRDQFSRIHQALKALTVDEFIPLLDYPNAAPVSYKQLRLLEDRGRENFDCLDVPHPLNVSQLLNGIERREGDKSSYTSLKEFPTMLTATPSATPTPFAELLERTGLRGIASDNIRYLSELADSARKGRVVPFVGAGLSMALGLLGWEKALDDIFTSVKSSLLADDIVNFTAAKTRGKWEDAAQALWDAPGVGAKVFNDRIKALFGKYALPNPITGAIAVLPKLAHGPVLTTNFDAALEKVYTAAGQTFTREQIVLGDYRADSVLNDWDEGGRFLLKLHGDADESNGRVLTKSQYDAAYGDASKLPELLRELFASRKPLLFLGCSLLTDRTMTQLKAAGLHQSNSYHFALMESPATVEERQKRQAELIAQYGIQPIWFAKGDFAAIERVLTFLAEVYKRKLTS